MIEKIIIYKAKKLNIIKKNHLIIEKEYLVVV